MVLNDNQGNSDNKRLTLTKTLHQHKNSMQTISYNTERLGAPFVLSNKLSIKDHEKNY